MTTIRLGVLHPTGTATDARSTGNVEWVPSARRVVGADVVLPDAFRVTLVADADVTVVVAPTTTAWVWRVLERVSGGSGGWRYLAVPDSAEVVDYAALVEVDPATLDPIAAAPTVAAELAAKVDRSGHRVSVWDYGVVGDGVVDDGPALQAAIAAAGEGGYIDCGKGTHALARFRCLTGLTMLDFQTIDGSTSQVGSPLDGGSVELTFPAFTAAEVGLTLGASNVVKNLCLRGPGSAVGTCTGAVNTASSPRFHNVSFIHWAQGAAITAGYYTTFWGCEFSRNGIGLVLSGCYNLSVFGARFYCGSSDATTNGIGISTGTVRGLNIIGGSIEQYGTGGAITVGNASIVNVNDVYFETAAAGASGITSTATLDKVALNLTGCMVYLAEHAQWVNFASATNSTLSAHGNKFTCGTGSTTTPYGYVFGTPQTTTAVDLSGDSWAEVVKVGAAYADTLATYPMTAPDVQTFTANGTWTKPPGAVTVDVLLIGPGGGGGAGARGPSGTALSGGGGGGGGAVNRTVCPASALAGAVVVALPAGGAGGAAQTTNGTAGGGGSLPSSGSTFGTYLAAARGGAAGGGGLGVAGSLGAISVGQAAGGAGGIGSATGAAGAIGATAIGAPGGGAGGGVTTAPTATAGGNGGAGAVWSVTIATGGTVPGGAGNPGQASALGQVGGGGSGGGGSAVGVAGSGGNGGAYGAGGGGGGAALNGNNSGAGGTGSTGVCVVTTYF